MTPLPIPFHWSGVGLLSHLYCDDALPRPTASVLFALPSYACPPRAHLHAELDQCSAGDKPCKIPQRQYCAEPWLAEHTRTSLWIQPLYFKWKVPQESGPGNQIRFAAGSYRNLESKPCRHALHLLCHGIQGLDSSINCNTSSICRISAARCLFTPCMSAGRFIHTMFLTDIQWSWINKSLHNVFILCVSYVTTNRTTPDPNRATGVAVPDKLVVLIPAFRPIFTPEKIRRFYSHSHSAAADQTPNHHCVIYVGTLRHPSPYNRASWICVVHAGFGDCMHCINHWHTVKCTTGGLWISRNLQL